MRQRRRSDDLDSVVRQRLRAVWPQADPVSSSSVDRWRDRDSVDPGSVDPGSVDSAADSPPAPSPPSAPPGRRALGSFDPGRRGIRALAAFAVLVLLAAGYVAWRSQPHAEPLPAAISAPPALSATSGPGASPGGGTIVVAVSGRVRHPGLVRLPAGARVADAIEAAGGPLPGTDLSFVNVARKLTDGELVVVGVTPPPGVDPGGGLGTGTGAGGGTAAGKVNLNTATLAELDSLPGVGPAIAQRIVDYRTEHGGFTSVDDLRKVEGIGDAKFAQLKDRVTV